MSRRWWNASGWEWVPTEASTVLASPRAKLHAAILDRDTGVIRGQRGDAWILRALVGCWPFEGVLDESLGNGLLVRGRIAGSNVILVGAHCDRHEDMVRVCDQLAEVVQTLRFDAGVWPTHGGGSDGGPGGAPAELGLPTPSTLSRRRN